MFTEQELYQVCCTVLLYSPLTRHGGDGYYFFGSTDEGGYEVTTHFNFEHCEDEGFSQHRALLEAGRSIIYIQTETEPHKRVIIAYPRDIRQNGFMWEDLVKIPGGIPDPNHLLMFGSGAHVTANEPWLQKIFTDLCEHIPG